MTHKCQSETADSSNLEVTALLGAGLDLVDVGLPRALIGRHKECIDLRFLGEPRRHLTELLAQARDGLVIHVGLRDEFGHGDCESLVSNIHTD